MKGGVWVVYRWLFGAAENRAVRERGVWGAAVARWAVGGGDVGLRELQRVVVAWSGAVVVAKVVWGDGWGLPRPNRAETGRGSVVVMVMLGDGYGGVKGELRRGRAAVAGGKAVRAVGKNGEQLGQWAWMVLG